MRWTMHGNRVHAAASLAALLIMPAVSLAQIRLERPPITTKTPMPAAGPAPVQLTVSSAPTSLGLRWGCPSGATGYEVYATPKGGTQIKLTPTPIGPLCIQDISLTLQSNPTLPPPTAPAFVTGYSHTGLTPGLELSYVVRALYATGGFGDTAPVTAQTSPWPAPAGFAAIGEGRTARLSWQPVAGAAGYLVYRQLQGESSFQPMPATTALTFVDRELPPVEQHRYYVRAQDGMASPVGTVYSGRPYGMKTTFRKGEPYIRFEWSGTELASFKLLRAGSLSGPWVRVTLNTGAQYGYTGGNVTYPNGFAVYSANVDDATVGTTQYYKFVFIWNAYRANEVSLESDVIPVTIPPA